MIKNILPQTMREISLNEKMQLQIFYEFLGQVKVLEVVGGGGGEGGKVEVVVAVVVVVGKVEVFNGMWTSKLLKVDKQCQCIQKNGMC